jgi:hypothetical protein
VRHFYEDCYKGVLGRLVRGVHFVVRGNAGSALTAGGVAALLLAAPVRLRDFNACLIFTSTTSHIVCAIPAVGKSAFGCYLLQQAVNANRTVIYISDSVMPGLIFHKESRVEAFTKRDFEAATASLLWDPDTVLLFDGDGDGLVCRPPIVPATTVLLISPKRQRYKEFSRTGVLDLVFPVFARAEMEEMLLSCFPEQAPREDAGTGAGDARTTPAWEECYAKWGGIPRYVFGLLGAADQATLESAVTSVNLDRVADVLYSPDIEDEALASHRLFHLKPCGERADGTFEGGRLRESYLLHHTELGSPFIRKAVSQAIQGSRFNRLMTLLAQPTRGTSLAKF